MCKEIMTKWKVLVPVGAGMSYGIFLYFLLYIYPWVRRHDA